MNIKYIYLSVHNDNPNVIKLDSKPPTPNLSILMAVACVNPDNTIRILLPEFQRRFKPVDHKCYIGDYNKMLNMIGYFAVKQNKIKNLYSKIEITNYFDWYKYNDITNILINPGTESGFIKVKNAFWYPFNTFTEVIVRHCKQLYTNKEEKKIYTEEENYDLPITERTILVKYNFNKIKKQVLHLFVGMYKISILEYCQYPVMYNGKLFILDLKLKIAIDVDTYCKQTVVLYPIGYKLTLIYLTNDTCAINMLMNEIFNKDIVNKYKLFLRNLFVEKSNDDSIFFDITFDGYFINWVIDILNLLFSIDCKRFTVVYQTPNYLDVINMYKAIGYTSFIIKTCDVISIDENKINTHIRNNSKKYSSLNIGTKLNLKYLLKNPTIMIQFISWFVF